jgi:pimeloyl-ACP methyl ester carboxylesterase
MLSPIQPQGDKPPLFWCHASPIDGVLSAYLGPRQPLYSFKHQGRLGERIELRTVESIAAHYLSEVLRVQSQGPYHLSGYSFGGTVAFEMARLLQRLGLEVGLLFLVDSLSPGTPHIAPPRRKHALACKACETAGVPVPYSLRNGRMMAVHLDAIAAYQPATPFDGTAVYIKSNRVGHAPRWATLCTDGIDLHELPEVDHLQIGLEPSVASRWAQSLVTELNRRGGQS